MSTKIANGDLEVQATLAKWNIARKPSAQPEDAEGVRQFMRAQATVVEESGLGKPGQAT